MNSNLLDADCAITSLITLQIIKDSNWKTQHFLNNDDADYAVYFQNPFKNGDVGLQIIKRADHYFISQSRIKILAMRHKFDATDIINRCAV